METAMRVMITALTVGLIAANAPLAENFDVDVWADNWFEMRVNGEKVAEDSVSITTERSFNAEQFSIKAERPFVIGLVAKDFKENDTGLEYIGSRRQQMGDGGVIMQMRNTAGETVVVSDDSWQCFVTHTAPLDKSCEDVNDPVVGQGACGFEELDEPAGWATVNFDAADWPQANIYSEAEVSPKMGYDKINWDENAQFIWGPDLEQSNTVLCRLNVE